MTVIDYIVVGAGVAGAYTAMELSKQKNKSVLLIEKSNRIGGRLNTVKVDKDIYLEAGGARFSNRHIKLVKLIKQLGLYNKVVKISSDSQFISYRKNYKDIQFESVEELIKDLVKKAKSLPKKTQMKYTFTEFCEHIYGQETKNYLINAFAYYGRINYMNLHDVIRSLTDYIDYTVQFYILAGGLQQVPICCVEEMKKNGGRLKLETELCDFTYNTETETYTVSMYKDKNQTSIECRNLIIAIPREFLEKIKYFKRDKELIQLVKTVRPYELMRIYARYPVPKNGKVWFHDLPGKFTTNNKLRFVIQIDPSKGTIMISYPNSDFTKYWNKVDNNGRLNETIMKHLKELFPEKDIPEPKWIKSYFWSTGGNTWLPGIDSLKISKKMLKPDKNRPLYVCGESYSRWQAWVEGALETSYQVLELIKHT